MCNVPNAVKSAQLKAAPTELMIENKEYRIKLLSRSGKIHHMKSTLMKTQLSLTLIDLGVKRILKFDYLWLFSTNH